MSTMDEAGDNDRTRSSEGTSSEDESSWGQALRDIAPYLDLGWRLAGTTAGPPVLGLVIDLWLQTTPWMLLVGCVFGLSGAVLQLKRLQGDLNS